MLHDFAPQGYIPSTTSQSRSYYVWFDIANHKEYREVYLFRNSDRAKIMLKADPVIPDFVTWPLTLLLTLPECGPLFNPDVWYIQCILAH